MCIAILKPKDKTLTVETLKTCFDNNKDGCGFAYCDEDTVIIKKFMKFEDFIKDYKEVENKSNMLIHFRIATHGGVNLESTHPFILNERMALIHNGIITGYGDRAKKSDTLDFIDKVLGNISWKMWKNPSFVQLVGDAIGYSKLCILDKSGDYFIVNEHKGEWVDGIWFSNSSYKPKSVYKSNTVTNNNKENKDTVPFEEDKKAKEYKDVEIIWKCNKCGQEFSKAWSSNLFCECPHCKSYSTEDIGWVQDGNTWYYNEVYSGC